MTRPPSRDDNHWARPHWHASDEDARLLFFVFGDFAAGGDALTTSLQLPAGIKLTRYEHAALKSWEGYPLTGSLGAVFEDDAPQALAVARRTPDVLRLGGSVHDPANLDYLRDTLGAVTRLLDEGGVAVVDPQTSGLFDRAAWHRHFADAAGDTWRQHVLVLCDADPEAPAYQWIHTRGMRKFARPDLSLTRVPPAEANRAGALCVQLVDMLALGGHFADGQPLTVDGLPAPLVARPGGDPDDPRFYNTHIELAWPAA